MVTNYLKVACRNLLKNKLYTTLNVAGLAFGLTCFLLISLYVYDELTFDHQHEKLNRIYRVVEHKNINGEASTIAAGGYKLAEESRKIVSEVENTTRMSRTGRANLINPDNPVHIQEDVTIVDENFLRIFDFSMAEGDRNSALSEPYSIVITESLAMNRFNSTKVIGKSLQFSHITEPLKITGVLKDHPANSSFDFNSLLSEATNRNADFFKQTMASDWASNSFSIYVLLKTNSNPELAGKKMTELVLNNFSPPAGTSLKYSLQPLKDIHLGSAHIIDGARNTNVKAIAQGNAFYIRIFSFIALFVLLIAGINYMNLFTARASNRSKEIGVRKSIGALKSNLTMQFMLEALLVTGISFVTAIILVNIILPSFNQFLNKSLSLSHHTDGTVWAIAIVGSISIALLSGIYPSLFLSGFNPVLLLKGMKIKSGANLTFRKSLVIFQFTLSTVMIIATIVLFLQVKFLNNSDLGFQKDLMVVIDVNTNAARNNMDMIKSEMHKIPSVKHVSATSRVPGEWKTYRMVKFKPQGSGDDAKTGYFFAADREFAATFEVDILKGRNFISIVDSHSVILNETAANLLNITEPSGQIIEIPSVSRGGAFSTLGASFNPKVVGIAKDFHFQSLRNTIEPLVLAYIQNPIHDVDYYTAKIDGNNVEATLDKLKAVMVNIDKKDPFEYHFLDDQLGLFYVEDHRRQLLLIWLALASVFIACLGLFGLATYAAEQRIKEIGVRKVLGASVINISTLLSVDFVKLVLVALSCAFPLAWWGANKWLQEYAYHIELEWWIFALAGVCAILIAMITVSYQAIKAALTNPVSSLRSE